MYSFDAFKLYKRLVPYFLRKPIFLAYLQVLSSALKYTDDLLSVFVDKTTKDMKFNAQVIYLEYILNDAFPASDPDIYIENIFTAPGYLFNDIEAQPAVYYWNNSEAQPAVYLQNFSEYAGAIQFIVHVDAALAGQVDEITALIELYTLAGVPYQITFDL